MSFEVATGGRAARHGPVRGPTLQAIIEHARPDPEASHATVVSADGYRASIPLDALRSSGRLSAEPSGQRLHVLEGETLCWNVKDVVALEFTEEKAPDDVPENPPH